MKQDIQSDQVIHSITQTSLLTDIYPWTKFVNLNKRNLIGTHMYYTRISLDVKSFHRGSVFR